MAETPRKRLAPPTPPASNDDRNTPPRFSTRQVRGALRSFSLGSSGGFSGLTPAHLVDATAFSGSPALGAIGRAVDLLSAGLVPLSARPFIFGARLVALEKTDAKNAFNSVSRQTFLDEVARVVPHILPHAVAAYGSESALFFGGHLVHSRAGVQQGDPLGPLFFSLALLAARREAVANASAGLPQRLGFEAAYLDDASFGGTARDTREYFDRLVVALAARGLEVNFRKTAAVLHPAASAETRAMFSDLGAQHSSEEFCLLGAPCGTSVAAAKVYVETRVARATRRCSLIGRIPDPQVAFALLRFCGAQPCANYFARAVGHIAADAFASLDAAAAAAFEEAVFHLPARALETARLPPRLGGLGLRSVAAVAPLAFAASSVSASALLREISRGLLACHK